MSLALQNDRLPRRLLRTLSGRLGSNLSRLLFPPRCVGCGEELPDQANGLWICTTCCDELPLVNGAACRRCGAIVPETGGDRDDCPRCADSKFHFDQAVALGVYAGKLRDWVLHMKHAAGDRLALALGEMLWQLQREELLAIRPDLVVPVPMHWSRRLARGTNSPSLTAEVMAGRLQVSAAMRLLKRRRNTPPQFTLPPSRRARNVRGAFRVRSRRGLFGAHVLLIDDVLTTGATASEAARTLKAAGASRVTVAVIARSMSQ